MTYAQAVAAIESAGRFGAKPGLERIRTLLCRLGDPQKDLRCVHVAGTNGKGTTCTLIASVLTQAGYRTGLFLSPHVCDFRERIQLDGTMIPRDELTALAEKVLPAAAEVLADCGPVTEFELITAAAFCWFAEKRCDAVVLEVGLGGRFDATNVIEKPLVSVITSLSLDHMKILGDTVEKIAFEKCGILKHGCPAVCYPEEPPEALAVIRRTARERGCPLTEAACTNLKAVRSGLDGMELDWDGLRLRLPFLGAHQVKNAATALCALAVLRSEKWQIPDAAVQKGFSSARIPARLEVLCTSPPVLLDGAHNPEGTAALSAAVREYLAGRDIVAVMGMLADKDVQAAVNSLAGTFSRVIATEPETARALPAGALAEMWRKTGTPVRSEPDREQALRFAFSLLKPGNALVICGSLYLAGSLRGPALKLIERRTHNN